MASILTIRTGITKTSITMIRKGAKNVRAMDLCFKVTLI